MDPFNRTFSANRGNSVRDKKALEYVNLELRPISEPPSMRDACLSPLNMSYRDMSQQVDHKEVAEQILQTLNAEVKSAQMETMFSGRLVDKCIETD